VIITHTLVYADEEGKGTAEKDEGTEGKEDRVNTCMKKIGQIREIEGEKRKAEVFTPADLYTASRLRIYWRN
jgi:hypothetical protein